MMSIGKSSPWLIGSDYSVERIDERLGICISIYSTYSLFKRCEGIEKIVDGIKRAEYLDRVIRDIVKKNKIDFLTLKCFDIIEPLNVTGCFAVAKLNDDMILSSCEGDIPSLLSMIIIAGYTGEPSFMANPSEIDFEKNEITFAHCTIPTRLTKKYEITTHFETGKEVGIMGDVDGSRFAIFKIDGELNRYNLFSGVKIDKKWRDGLCRTQVTIELEQPVKKFIEDPIGNHVILFQMAEKKIDEFEEFVKMVVGDYVLFK
jgi:L-fucose isomerase-like protein